MRPLLAIGLLLLFPDCRVLGQKGQPGLPEIMQDTDLERRAMKAVDYSEIAVKQAQEQFQAGNREGLESALENVAGSAELASKSLKDTGKRTKSLAGRYKRGELKFRAVLRQLDSLIKALNFADREKAESVRKRVQTVHEEFLQAVMRRN